MHIIAGMNSRPKPFVQKKYNYGRGEARRFFASFLRFLFHRKVIIILLSFFTAGVLLGSAAVGGDGEISEHLQTLAHGADAVSVGHDFSTSFQGGAIITVTTFALCSGAGVCAAGLPVIVSVCAAKGISLGVLCGYLYTAYSYKGLARCLLLVVPGSVITTGALLIFCAEGISMSCDTLLALGGRKQIKSNTAIKSYCLKFAALFALGIAGDALNSLLGVVFGSFFTA